MKKSQIYIIILAGIVLIIIALLYFSRDDSSSSSIRVPAKFGDFQVNVTTTGELEAKNSEKILGPFGLRNFRIWNVKIEDIIPDGTVVDSGDYVAALDRTELVDRAKDKELDVEKYETQYTKTLLDTTLELRTARDNLINLNYNLEEKQIVVDQSIYEPPATQRQAKIDLDKAKRNYSQAVKNYEVTLEKAEATMQEVSASLRKARQEYQQMMDLLNEFTIFAPKGGMVIYRRNWDGQKQGIGATISVWDPVVAELPNLREMISKTYINEIDISKVRTGQSVEIGVDAFPDKSFTGLVTEVANIGQQLPNSNAKVFEVVIEVHEYDSVLRPAMTTKNSVITATYDSVLYLPLECIHANDSISFVFADRRRKQVITGASNDNEIIIRAGLEQGDEAMLTAPDNPESYNFTFIDTEIIEKLRLEDEKNKAQKQVQAKDPDQEQFKEMMKNMSKEDLEKMRKNGDFKRKGGGRKTKK